MSMTKSFDPSAPFPNRDAARTRRQLRFVKALYRINDPELEQALAVILERLADNQPGSAFRRHRRTARIPSRHGSDLHCRVRSASRNFKLDEYPASAIV